MRPKIRQIAPLIAVSALVLCLYPLRAKKQAEEQQAARELVRPTDGDAVSPEAMPLPEGLASEEMPPESDEVIEETTPEQQAQEAAGAEYLDGIRQIPGAAPLLDDVIAYLKGDGADLSLDDLPVDEEGMIALDDPLTEKLIQNPAIKAKWDQLMALIAANPPPKHQLRN